MNETKLFKVAKIHSDYVNRYHKYKMVYWDQWDYEFLTSNIMYYKKKGKYRSGTYNDIIIMGDTETSKDHESYIYDEFGNEEPLPNHVCAWTISLRAYHKNIVTLYGAKPSEMVKCMQLIRKALKGDEVYIYFHNLSYDYFFLRQFLFDEFGFPVSELNTKPHYPVNLKFKNGIILKDSLILFGCRLEKAAKDYGVEHQKAVGSWDYSLIRDQDWIKNITKEEKKYIEQDTLAGVECLDALCLALGKTIYSIPFTATGIPREEVRIRAQSHKGHDNFMRQALTWEQQQMIYELYHGGYTHANRYYIDDLLNDSTVMCFDFNSSYPFCMLAFKYPSGKFIKFRDCEPKFILENKDNYAWMFKISFVNIKLKDLYEPMPALQSTKCQNSINLGTDNGRVISAGYCSIYLNEIDLEVINSQYEWYSAECTSVFCAPKDYLPRWFTDYVFELYTKKCQLAPRKKEDPVNYALAKAKVNSLYGLTVQRPVQRNIIEVTEPGMYKINPEGDEAFFGSGEYRYDFDMDMAKEYEKYCKKVTSVLNYQIGCWVTSYAFSNLILGLGGCIKRYYGPDGKLLFPPHWYYTDTDSGYSDDWDYNAIWNYNDRCKKLLTANGYGPVVVGENEYWLGVMSHEEPDDSYTEFKVLGSKRYAGRCKADDELHITVAGVPKKGAVCLNDDLNNFTKDFIFDGKVTGKLTHYYIPSKDGIYIDQYGNEIGDSIDLKPCDYRLDMVYKWEFISQEEVKLQIYDEEDMTL